VFETDTEAFTVGYAKYLHQRFMAQPITEYLPLIRLPWLHRRCHT
jgi:hypothetical protein